jgi:hypothetical protein
MSKIGRVVQEIMERFDGDIPEGYTLAHYFRDKEYEESLLQKQREKISLTAETVDEASTNN